jgi:hypothetical protein
MGRGRSRHDETQAFRYDRPVKITVELPAPVFRDLQAYAAILARIAGEAAPPDPTKLVAPMLQRFMATDKGFTKAKRGGLY